MVSEGHGLAPLIGSGHASREFIHAQDPRRPSPSAAGRPPVRSPPGTARGLVWPDGLMLDCSEGFRPTWRRALWPVRSRLYSLPSSPKRRCAEPHDPKTTNGGRQHSQFGRSSARLWRIGCEDCGHHFVMHAPDIIASTQTTRRRRGVFFAKLGADIWHGGDRAYYASGPAYVQLAPFACFFVTSIIIATCIYENHRYSCVARAGRADGGSQCPNMRI